MSVCHGYRDKLDLGINPSNPIPKQISKFSYRMLTLQPVYELVIQNGFKYDNGVTYQSIRSCTNFVREIRNKSKPKLNYGKQ